MYNSSQFPNIVLHIFNIIIAVFGIVLIVFGAIYTVSENNGVKAFLDFSLGPLAAAVGVLTLLTAIGGCAAAHADNNCLLTIYASILVAFFAIQLAFGAIVIDSIVRNVVLTYVKYTMRDLFGKDDLESMRAFHDIEREFKCCGVEKYNDYLNAYPPSCCDVEVDPCHKPRFIGCAKAFTDAIEDYVLVIGAIALVFAVVEILAAIFTFRRIRYKDDYYYTHSFLCCSY